MVLSKGQKIILIAATVVVVLVAAFFGFYLYRNAQSKLDAAIEPVLGGYARSTADPYDAETVDNFIEQFWDPVKDKSSFQKKLVKQLQEQVIDLSFQNAALDSDDRIRNEFWEEVTDAQKYILPMMPFLQQVGYEEENLKACLQDYYVRLAENERTELESAAAESAQAEELNAADGLLSVLDKVSAFNDASAAYYQIDENEIIPLEEIGGHYQQAIALARDADDTAVFVKALSNATSAPLLQEQTFLDSSEIADSLIDDGAAIYTLRNGIGGYYDTVKINESGVKYYGDFATRTRTTGGNKYDTSAMTPGLWSALSPGQRAEIQSGNSTKTYYYYYLLGEDLDSSYDSDLADLAQSGYEYVFCNPDGSAMFVSDQSATCYTNGGAYCIEGDFTQLVEQAAAQYNVSDDTDNADSSAIQGAVTAFLAGDYDAAEDIFLSCTGNGSKLTPICQFIEQMAQSGYYDEGVDLAYNFLNLSDPDLAQLEIFLSELPQ